MKVAYIQLPDGNKLISYHRHDFKSTEIDGKLYMIDGGQGNIIRCSGQVMFAEVDDLIETIRSEYAVKYIVLKYLTITKIKKVIKYVKNLDKILEADLDNPCKFSLEILEAELKYRKNNNII